MKNRFYKQNKGITLIALVITIIVLLILAGIAISVLAGDDGIIKKAVEARGETEGAAVNEEDTLNDMESLINDYTAKTITFTIDGQTYSAKEGMTWKEWCDSEFNTVNAFIEEVDWGRETTYKVVSLGEDCKYLTIYSNNDFSKDHLEWDDGIYFPLNNTKIVKDIEYVWNAM